MQPASQLHAAARSQRARSYCSSTAVAGGAAACGNGASQAVVIKPLPFCLNQGHQRVSPDGHGVRLGWRVALPRAVVP